MRMHADLREALYLEAEVCYNWHGSADQTVHLPTRSCAGL